MDFDVVIASDLRFPGGTSHSIAEEIVAQRAGGYTTALAHQNGPLIKKLHPVNPMIRRQVERGAAELLIRRIPVRARVLVLRHPAVAQTALDQLPPIEVETVVVVANAGPLDIDGARHYDPAKVDAQVRAHLGLDPIWAPIGPLVRAEIASFVPPERLTDADWVNIIDVDTWAVDRPGWNGTKPVIGRHSRPSPQKWPEDARTLRQVYPVDGVWDVRVLGGADAVERLLGSTPKTWTVLPFGAVPPQDFLANLDFFVYYHDSRWVEAFGRTILEAIASGLPAIVPPHFQDLFGPAALYSEPPGVRALVDGLRADRDRYEEHVRQAREHVRATFGHEAHRARLAALIGPPSTEPSAQPSPIEKRSPSPAGPTLQVSDSSKPRVLLMSSNGSGMGHLTRLLAYARRLEDRAQAHFLSMSQAAPVVGTYGFPYEYLPSTGALAMAPSLWHEMFAERVSDSLRRIRPEVVVFDGTWPYNAIPTVREAFPNVRWIWSRRGMWREGANTEQVKKARWFDEVIEPGDFSSAYDRGATNAAQATRLDPVTLLDRSELDDRTTARRALGLPVEAPMALISLGAGNINDTSDDIGAATTALLNLGIDVCLTQPEIAEAAASNEHVRLIRDYPLARRYAAFDVVISAAGYNSFQELMRMGVPSLLVPNESTALDDQGARARYAADRGWAHTLERLTVETAQPLLADLIERGADMVGAAQAADPGNGAAAAADIILGAATSEERGR
ncbi:glycosyltransferase [Pseudactinotalea sp. Z1748]|uniref:glycosyltransferase n=1 Tax=Pseudactinotalea sp. Z1748 TaxID=3413027 RepID=UPI003C7D119A